MELSDAFAEGGVQIPSPNPRWKQASILPGFESRTVAQRVVVFFGEGRRVALTGYGITNEKDSSAAVMSTEFTGVFPLWLR